jgi:integrase
MTRRQGGTMRSRTAPLVRVPRTLPRILSPAEADRLVAALRTHRDQAMVLAGLRRCEVLGLRFADVQVADRRLVITDGKGGHHRVVLAANRFFDPLGERTQPPWWRRSGLTRHSVTRTRERHRGLGGGGRRVRAGIPGAAGS